MVTVNCCATWPLGHGSLKVQQDDPGGPKMFVCCGSAHVPHVNPFQQSTTTTTLLQLPPHPGAQVAVGGGGVSEGVGVIVGVQVIVGLRVNVCETVLVDHGVHVRERVGGQVMVRVGDCGTAQQIVISIRSRHI